jgi:hypothetical protein
VLSVVFEFVSAERAERAAHELGRKGFRAHAQRDGDAGLVIVSFAGTEEPAGGFRGLVEFLGGTYRGSANLESAESESGPSWRPRMVELASPRDLGEDERSFLDFMLEHPESVAALREQARAVKVVSVCDCGCRSIGVGTDDSCPRAHPDPRMDTYWRDDYFTIEAQGTSKSGNDVVLVLHVMDGRMIELEIWDGPTEPDGRSRGEVPELATLRYG